ncbi:hypothetical protein LCGC14_1763920 [marine sediment metagenome]|uniref:Uncharacterized protein n=1 Tax=marine sediment metagenome TaxID=412755 RepID=A0A0F9H075_9ZZZZ
MRITFKCINSGGKAAENGKVVYYAHFGVVKEGGMKYFGQVSLECFEPMHYKVGKKYDVDVTEHSGLTIVPPGTKIPKKMVN